jgi:hypothetical protein
MILKRFQYETLRLRRPQRIARPDRIGGDHGPWGLDRPQRIGGDRGPWGLDHLFENTFFYQTHPTKVIRKR